ncbi:hypothetical protein ACFQXB_15610 [Plastorhodobacter daqingensis]|uniref:Cyclic di-GMP-binding protein n=1 Tax=Plastorhodobacter daqingensis TaxID=1387281 RepID=A0ABW2UQJ1_9RHOB
MKDLIRLIGVGALVFFVVGFAMIYSRDSGFRAGVSAFIAHAKAALGRTLSGMGQGGAPEMAVAELRLPRPKPNSWMGLTGFPDQMELRFPIPAMGGFIGGDLDLRFEAQLAEGGDGLLSIAVNGTRRREIVLNTGSRAYNIRIPLEPADLLGNHALVQLSARGTTNSGQICPADSANWGSAIALLPESALLLRSIREAVHPETDLVTMPEPLNLRLGTDLAAQAIAVWAMQRMRRAGVEVALVDDTHSGPSIEIVEDGHEPVGRGQNATVALHGNDGIAQAISFHRAELSTLDALADWPVSVGHLTPETTVRNFRGSRRWHIPYRIADLPQGRMPTRFDLALRTSVLADDLDWVVRVSLNGNLLETARLPGSNPDIRMSVVLPTDKQGLSNTLLVELVDTSPNTSICRVGPDALAQLLPESHFTAAGSQPRDGWGALVRQLAEVTVSPGNHGPVDVVQATRAAAMLGKFLPTNAQTLVAPQDAEITITLVDKARLAAVLSERAARPQPGQMLLITDTGGSLVNPLELTPLEADAAQGLLARMHATDIAFLVARTPPP